MSSAPLPAPRKRGCLFYGCITVIVIGLLIAAVLVAGYFAVKRFATRTINDYTETNPAPIEVVTYAPEDRTALQKRLDTFNKALDAGKAGEEIVLSAADINALISDNPQLKGKLYLIIEDDTVKGRVSVPLSDILSQKQLEALKLTGRYLSGVATFRAGVTNGALDVHLEDILVRDKELPSLLKPVVDELKKQNLAKDYQATPEQKAYLSKVESIVVKDGKVHLRSRGKP